jgi:anti-sigma factor RsiW
MTQTPSFRDVQQLSAYLDGQLKPSEIVRLEARLQSDPELASVLNNLRQARDILRQLPQRRAPRNFTLTPKMVGQKPPLPRTYPVFRFATVLATLLLFFTFATNFMAPRLVRTGAPFPYGIGGSGGGGGAEPEFALEEAAPAEPPAAAAPAAEEPAATEEAVGPELPAPAPTLMAPSADNSARVEPTIPTDGVQKAAPGDTFAQSVPTEETLQTQPALPIGVPLQIVLAGVAILSAITAFTLRYSAIRKWRAKAK